MGQPRVGTIKEKLIIPPRLGYEYGWLCQDTRKLGTLGTHSPSV